MENERYIRRVDFSNKAKRVPVCFCIDTQHSMGFIDPKLGGYKVVNPAERGEILKKQLGREPSHKEYMNYLLPMLLNCDHISLLPGWDKSKGAKVEYDVALATGKTIIDVKVISQNQ